MEWRVRASRWAARKATGHDVMLCALADWHRWRTRKAFDLIFRHAHKRHCERMADWEAFIARRHDLDLVDFFRRNGLL